MPRIPLVPNVNRRQISEQTKYLHQPNDNGDAYNAIQNALDGRLHWHKSIHEPKQNSDHNQNQN
jgi:hypothetical protein